MKALDFSPALRWLFCFAHPDDELAVAVIMRRLVLSGATVHAAWFHSTPKRRAESEAAADMIGLGPAKTFLDFPDGKFVDDFATLIDAVSRIAESFAPDRVVCASFEQGHLDHDALNFAVSKAFGGPIIEFPEYWPYTPRVRTMNRFANPVGEEVLQLKREEQDWKRRLARSYPSQGIRSYIGWYELWTRLKLKPAKLIETERVRLQPKLNYSIPAHEERMRQRIIRTRQWKTWSEALSKLGT